MAKSRAPRSEIRATTTQAPYRRDKPTVDSPPPTVELPASTPAPAGELPSSTLAPTVELPASAPAPAPPPEIALDLPMPLTARPEASAGLAAPVDVAAYVAVAHQALGFARAALATLPSPSELVERDPTSPEPPPGRAPAGDARSLRNDGQFALVYRRGAAVVSRRGKLGEHGVWRVVNYPGPGQAAHAYALECSRLLDQGFRDTASEQ